MMKRYSVHLKDITNLLWMKTGIRKWEKELNVQSVKNYEVTVENDKWLKVNGKKNTSFSYQNY